jgi:hypothetical protein
VQGGRRAEGVARGGGSEGAARVAQASGAVVGRARAPPDMRHTIKGISRVGRRARGVAVEVGIFERKFKGRAFAETATERTRTVPSCFCGMHSPGCAGGRTGGTPRGAIFFRMKLVYSGEGFGAGWGAASVGGMVGARWRIRTTAEARKRVTGVGSGAIRAVPSPTLSLRRSMARVEAAVMEDTGAGGRRQEGEYARL